jgi:hypothetical protein
MKPDSANNGSSGFNDRRVNSIFTSFPINRFLEQFLERRRYPR